MELAAGWSEEVRPVFPPTGSLGLSYLEIVDIGWDDIHDAIQRELSVLSDAVAVQVPNVECRSGRTAGRSFPLFSYRTFRFADDPEFDPIVAGVNFADRGTQILISGDISGEESGEVFYSDEHCERVVERATLPTLLREGSKIARNLAARHEVVVESLRARGKPVAPEDPDSSTESR
jgi:hypothetical protein